MKTFQNSQHGKSYFLFILIAIVAIGSGILVQNFKQPPSESPEFKKIILLPTPKELGEVNFTDHNGKDFGLKQFQGQWSIVFFGFTNCPDVCPTTMQTLKQVKQNLSNAGAWDNNYQVVMVSVDPPRDSIERLSNYVPFFDPEFIGLRAPVEHTAVFAKNLGILFFKSKELDNGGYDVDHGAAIILINPQGQYAGVMTAPHIQADISADLIKLAEYAGVIAPKKSSDVVDIVISSNNIDSEAVNNTLTLEKAWIRPAPPQAPSMAAYFDFVNHTENDITIVDSSSPQFMRTMIHDTTIEDGIASMEHLDEVVIPAGGKLSLAPAAKHLMLMGSKAPLIEGDSVDVQFEADDGRRYDFSVMIQQQPTQ